MLWTRWKGRKMGANFRNMYSINSRHKSKTSKFIEVLVKSLASYWDYCVRGNGCICSWSVNTRWNKQSINTWSEAFCFPRLRVKSFPAGFTTNGQQKKYQASNLFCSALAGKCDSMGSKNDTGWISILRLESFTILYSSNTLTLLTKAASLYKIQLIQSATQQNSGVKCWKVVIWTQYCS